MRYKPKFKPAEFYEYDSVLKVHTLSEMARRLNVGRDELQRAVDNGFVANSQSGDITLVDIDSAWRWWREKYATR